MELSIREGEFMAVKLVKSDRTAGREPPRELGQHGKKLWDNITAEWVIEDSAGVAMLALACECLDRAESLREQIAVEGQLLRSKSGIRDNPLLKHELQNRAFVVRTLSKLGLDAEPLRSVGRPPMFGS